MAFLNKSVLTKHGFHHPLSILLVQLVATVVLLRLFKRLGLIEFQEFQEYRWSEARPLLVVSLLYALNVGISLSSLAHINIPMHSALKRLTILFALAGEQLVLHTSPSLSVTLSVALIAVGAFIAGAGDLEFSFNGYVYALASCVFQATFLVLLKKAHLSKRFNSTALVYYNALLSLPLVFLATVASGDLTQAIAFIQDRASFAFLVTLASAILLGSLLNYAMFLCATLTSPVTLTAAGQAKAVVQTIVGVLVYVKKISTLNLLGLTLNLIGGVGYAYFKHVEGSKKSEEEADLEKAQQRG